MDQQEEQPSSGLSDHFTAEKLESKSSLPPSEHEQKGETESPKHSTNVSPERNEKSDGPSASADEPESVPSDQTSHKFDMPLIHEVPFVFVICSSNILTQAALGMTIPPLQIIGRSFGSLNPGQLSWFVASYSLTVGTFILVAGRLGDMYGHKRLFISGFFWYAFWSLIAGFSAFSHSQIFFDVCRAMQGIGPALMVPNSLAILGQTYPQGRRKEMIFSVYGATAPNGFICGAVFGSLLAEKTWWPWEFWVMTAACCVLGLTGMLVVPSPKSDSDGKRTQYFDWAGAISGIAGLVLFNVAWNQAPIVGWQNPYVIVFLVLGVLVTAAFLWIESRVDQPLIPKAALSKKVGFVLGCIALGWSSFGIWVFYYFQFLINLRHIRPLLGAAQTAPAGIAGICAAMTTGYILSRVPTPLVMAFSMLPFCVGNILLATQPVKQTYWIQTFLSTIITPWGMDMSFPAATIILSDLVPREHQGIAASLVVTVVNYSISIGLGIAGTVEVHTNAGGRDLLRGYRGAFYAAIGLSGLGFILALSFLMQDLCVRQRLKHSR